MGQVAGRWGASASQSRRQHPHSFRFSDGTRPLLGIDLLDYRGGALEDEVGAASGDVPELHERLRRPDSVYLCPPGRG